MGVRASTILRRNKAGFLAALLLLLPPVTYAQSAPSSAGNTVEPEMREVVAGTVDLIDFDFFPSKVDVGDSKLLSFNQVEGTNQLKIFPLKAGTTNLIIRDARQKIRKNIKYVITATDLSLKVEQMRSLLDTVEGISITSVGDKIVIDGDLVVPKDLDRVINVTEAFGGAKGGIVNLVQLSRVSQRVIAQKIEREIRTLPSAQNVSVRVANDTFFLEGVVDDAADRQRAEEVARTFVPEILTSRSVADGILREVKKQAIRNMILVADRPPDPPPKMIRVTFHFVEISKEYLKNVFFKWAPGLSTGAGIAFGQSQTGGIGATSNGTFSGTLSNLIPRLQKGTNGGYARVLFSTVAIGKDRTNISIDRTDNVPFISQVVNGVPVTAVQPVGIQISVNPEIVGNEQIELRKTEFNFGALAGGAGAGGAPRTTNTSLINTVTVRSGDSAVLGGLVSNNMALDVDKDPEGGGDGQNTASPIFTLLRSKAFRSSKTQFLVFVTPQIIEDAAEGTADIKKKIIGNKVRRKRYYQ